ncbi:MAG TPA: GspH/FimT family pseudopilin [Gemmatimonadota bacterium]|nr:GspH/FimT family pseudopilin [Gemmatimonadota bacterium]
MPRSRLRRTAGHSLADTLIVLAVLAVLLSTALPDLARARDRFAALASARQLRADLAHARMLAILRGRTVTVAIDTVAGAYTATLEGGTPEIVRRVPASVRIRTTAHLQSIPFTARGTTDLYSTTWIGPAEDPGGTWHGIRVAPSGSLARP